MNGLSVETMMGCWFGSLDQDGMPPSAFVDRWFDPPASFDQELAEHFGDSVEDALSGKLDAWTQQPRSSLALILMLDQLTRNLYRGTQKAFAGDARALAIARASIDAGEAILHAPIERVFLYMPLMHAEDLALQDRCIGLFDALAAVCDGPLAETVRGSHAYAVRHREAIALFGRFPSRNEPLGRVSTPEERAWLEAHPGGF